MDKLQQYLISHPQIARSYARIWETVLKTYPQVAKFRTPKQWDDFLHSNENTLNAHLSSVHGIGKSEMRRIGEMMWYYGPAALSSPVQTAISALEGVASAVGEAPEKDEKGIKDKENDTQEYPEIPVMEDEPPHEKLQDATSTHNPQTSTPPSPTAPLNKTITPLETVPIVIKAEQNAPLTTQENASQKIQMASEVGRTNSVEEKITTAAAQAPQTPSERLAKIAEETQQTESAGLVNEHGAPLQRVFSPLSSPTSSTEDTNINTPDPTPDSDIDKRVRSSYSFYEDGTETDDYKDQKDSSAQQFNSRDMKRLHEERPLSRPLQRRTPSQPQPGNTPQTMQGGGEQPPRPPRRPRLPKRLGGAGNIGKVARLVANGAKVARVAAFFSTPAGWITLGIIAIVIIVLLLVIILSGGKNNDDGVNVTVSKTGPVEVPNPTSQVTSKPDVSDILYQIVVGWSGGPSSIIVTDKIPENTSFISAGNGGKYDSATRTVTWTISGNNSEQESTEENTPTPDPNAQSSLLEGYISPSLQRQLRGLTNSVKTPPIVQKVYAQATIDVTRYYESPYNLPPANGESDTNYSEEAMNNANTLGGAIASIQAYLLTKYPATHVDPFLAVMWTMAIEGSGADPYFWNCNETYKGKENISRGCRGWYNSGNWQVGYGIQVSQAASHLVEDFNAIYGKSDASIVQEVGNRVIQGGGITNPSSMPSKSVEQLVQEAGRPGTIFQERPTTDTEAAAQQAIAILLMDPKIGAASIAQEVAGDIGSDWASNMRGWGQSYYINGLDPSNPIFSNRIKLLAEKYTGVGGSIGGLGSGSQTLTLTLRPTDPDSWVINYATASAIGGSGGGSGSLNIPPGMDGQCTPTGEYPSNVTSELQTKYNTKVVGYSDEYAKYIYDVFTCLSETNFKDLVGAGTTVTNVAGGSYYMLGCEGGCKITMEANLPEGNFKHILIHEFGHMIDASNRREVILRDEFSQAYGSEKGLSPYSGPFYLGQGSCPVKGEVEDFAENVAYFYQPSSGYGTGGCDKRSSFPNPLYDTELFPLHMDVAKKTLIP